jgi:hypothetical protein
MVNGDTTMRTLSLIVAVAFFLVGPSLASAPEGGLPGIGTFSYNGSAIMLSAPPLLVAAR